ncbi:MAG: hypothetical protein SFZ24_01610 [Planctomycetota bacterium]|nr:hypothetical protein [Planctomycetota bacterium]
MHDALAALGARTRLTLFPGVGHGSWEPAYRDPALREWLLDESRR